MEKRSKEKVGLVFIHGAGLGSRIWEQVAEGLESPYLSVDFPQRDVAEAHRQELSLQDYTAYIKRQIEAWDVEKFVIAAHSLGGILALPIADEMPDRLVGFVAIGAAIPKRSRSFVSVLPFAQRIVLSVILRTAGTKPPESAIRKGLCNDLAPEQAAEVVRSFMPESIRVYTDRVEAAVPNVPKLYVKLANDREFSPSRQDKMIANLAPHRVEVLNTGHLPMLSKPDELRQVINAFLSNLDIDSGTLNP